MILCSNHCFDKAGFSYFSIALRILTEVRKRLVTSFDQGWDTEVFQPEQMARFVVGNIVLPVSVMVNLENNLRDIHSYE